MDFQTDDLELVERSKSGDRDAFNELVIKHRAKAVNWAYSIIHDAYWAEDIVQDALINSYLQLESLAQPERFIPWLRQIVRNKAVDTLRKNKRNSLFAQHTEEVSTVITNTPEIISLTNEWMESISAMIESLSERNRSIVEAYFFHQHSPEELADAFSITTGNVYNIISRSKMKLQEERFKRETIKNIEQYKAMGLASFHLLPIPQYQSAYTSLGHILHEVLNYTNNNNHTLSDIMGFTGQAFRIQMTTDCGLSSSLIYDWGSVMERIAITYGHRAKWIGRPERVLTPDTLIQALDMIRESINKGMPAIVWNLIKAEFGIIYGYNDASGHFTYRNAVQHSLEVPYDKLGRTLDNPELFVGVIEAVGMSTQPSIAHALNTIIRHARGKEATVPGYVTGIAAYAAWIKAFEENRVLPVGHAYNVALLTEARQHAIFFLNKWKEHPTIRSDPGTAILWQDAINDYNETYQAFTRLYPSFPYGMPGLQIDIHEQSILQLRQAKDAEEKGIERLEQIFSKISIYS
ncbi:RNA polymerase sigma factor [Cohnella abietis]|uniref:RNA polymerase sigma factor n=1 Tax=Cohnella abietis TaxID=2507935 RepID=A0A3T1D5L8_9BACL|nr:RNA polymerase sigma factor [Cohnella abietis]BBI33391.1 hypothetical protein KCTCHS21_27900 [Cohnella abietis]